MRFLVVSAFLACAAAAPSHLLAPVAVPQLVPVAGVAAVPVAYSAAVPTLSPGDIQAAAIDAQVKANDLTIAAVDKARELNDQAAENLKQPSDDLNAKVIVRANPVKENNELAFWAIQDKQWQVLDALKTAEAQLDGALARDSPVLANHAVVRIAPVSPYLASIAPIASVAPVAYSSGIVAPVVKTVEAKPEELKVEAKPEEKNEALVKSAEEKKEDNSVVVEATAKNLEAKPQLAPLAIAPLAIQAYYNQGLPISAPYGPVALSSPVLQYTAFPQVGLAPAIVKTAW